MNIICFIVKNGFEEDFMKIFKILINFNFEKYILHCENDVFKNNFKNQIKLPNVEVYENNNNFYCYGEHIYEIVCKKDAKYIFIFVNDKNIDNMIYKFSKCLECKDMISILTNKKYSNFNNQLNIINIDLIEKLFCYNYPKILLDKDFYEITVFMIDSNALWIKKMLFELKFMSNFYIRSQDEFNFTLNFLNCKYQHHYVKML